MGRFLLILLLTVLVVSCAKPTSLVERSEEHNVLGGLLWAESGREYSVDTSFISFEMDQAWEESDWQYRYAKDYVAADVELVYDYAIPDTVYLQTPGSARSVLVFDADMTVGGVRCRFSRLTKILSDKSNKLRYMVEYWK